MTDPHWQRAIQEELQSLTNTNTWDITPFPLNKKVVGSKWVFKLKFKPDGTIDRHKAACRQRFHIN